jgi:hypothetical protein
LGHAYGLGRSVGFDTSSIEAVRVSTKHPRPAVTHYRGEDPAWPSNRCRSSRSLATSSRAVAAPSSGSATLAIGRGHAAIDAGHRVYYTTAADLVARCHKAAIEGRWATTMRFFAAPQLLIIDELGYLPLTSEAASSLFQVLNRRYTLGQSIVLTINRGISQWGEIFDDPVVAAAMLGRLMHRSVIVPIDGESYRMRRHLDHTQNLRKAITLRD